jgi:Domain of unknown function (DUF397)
VSDELTTAKWFKSSKSNGQNNCVEAMRLPDGGMAIRDTKDRNKPAHVYTAREWQAFIEGVKAGEFDV